MIEVNLLPEELRKGRKKIELPKIEFMPFIIGALIFILSLQIIFAATLKVKRISLRRLEARWVRLEAEERELSDLKRQINSLNNKIISVEGIRKNRILWAKKMNDLSDSMIQGIWLTELSLEESGGQKYLSIMGAVSSYGKDEAAVIGKFMKSLKDNKAFFEDFSEIKLGTMQQRKLKDFEIMDFSITCYFKK